MATWQDRGKKLAQLLGELGASALKSSAKASGKIAKGSGRVVVASSKAAGRAAAALGKSTVENARRASANMRQRQSAKERANVDDWPEAIPPSSVPIKSKVSRRPKDNRTTAYNVAYRGLPHFSYSPHPDGKADPGEVIWTWIPYSDDPSIGKDRPALVVAQSGKWLIVCQLTSKDHDADRQQELAEGRHWLKIGTGNWDTKHRTSFMRVDRLLQVLPEDVRREGGRLPQEKFNHVVQALTRFHQT